ncbi:threonine dehydrogenase [Lactobacillus nasalidis]|uniref:Threonine dehydrogenase n=1 Tax=Lactobacillus nasalidis TaxID=2797258 RepID=A0ABQ3W5Q2_9LACO|nr:alcohol dehydrogenase catalytic domain-containing protein [Lactobacillus nasalidis]GHV97008.1 threonine dehydrogenase [Lactobacillus nasalidis]GHV99156.1 threonine dehydrogenase [Lactobacillus nasalidis]GHW00675.1 threonine dehydrogenase [Lactobacillus nasalidis]
MKTMKAAIYYGQKHVEVKELPIEECGPDDVLVQNIYSSICGTDVAVYQHGPNTGHKVTPGGEFGHETVSRVVKVGENVKDVQVGDRIYPYPLLAKNDISRAGTLGGFSQYMLLPKAKLNRSFYKVPAAISDRLAALTEPFTVGTRAARRGNPQAGEHGIVFGAGTIGIAAAVALKHFGMDKVMICDLADFRLNIARELGFEVCNPGKEDWREKAQAYFGQARSLTGEVADIDEWVDAAGATSILDDFFDFGKISSRFVAVAVNNKPRQVDLLHMTYAQQSLIGSGGYFPEDVKDVFAIMSSGKWPLEKMITQEYPLDQIVTGLETASDPSKALNVIVKPN